MRNINADHIPNIWQFLLAFAKATIPQAIMVISGAQNSHRVGTM